MSDNAIARLNEILALGPGPRLGPLVEFAGELAADANPAADVVDSTVAALVTLLNQCVGSGKDRMALGVALGSLGDPRLSTPGHDDYWVDVQLDDGSTLQVGRFHVTTAEFQEWVRSGGYADEAHWSAGGHAWRSEGTETWADLAAKGDVAHLVVPNQPVAGPTYWEARPTPTPRRRIMGSEHRWICAVQPSVPTRGELPSETATRTRVRKPWAAPAPWACTAPTAPRKGSATSPETWANGSATRWMASASCTPDPGPSRRWPPGPRRSNWLRRTCGRVT